MISRETWIFILQNLEFLINFQLSNLHPSHQTQFLGLEIESLNIIVSVFPCQGLLNESTGNEPTDRSLLSAAIVVLPAPLQY